jgi:hypothetical protein
LGAFYLKDGESLDQTRKTKQIAYKISIRKPEGKIRLGRFKHSREDNIKLHLKDTGQYAVDWIRRAQENDQWGVFEQFNEFAIV